MLVQGRSLLYGAPGRRSRSGWRSRPGRKGGHEHLRSGRFVAQRGMGPDRIVVPSPAFDDDLSLLQGVKDLSIQQLISEPTSVTPIERTASATGVPWAVSTSTWRSLAIISSGLCLFLDMGSVLLQLSRAIPQGRPLQRGRINRTLRAWVFTYQKHNNRNNGATDPLHKASL